MKKTYNLIIWMLASFISASQNSKHRKPKKPNTIGIEVNANTNDTENKKAEVQEIVKNPEAPAEPAKNSKKDVKLPFDLKNALENPGTEEKIAIDIVEKLLSKSNRNSVHLNVQMYGLVEQMKQRLIPFIVPEDVMQKLMEGMKGGNDEETTELVRSVRQIIKQYPEIHNLTNTLLAAVCYVLNSNYVVYYGFDSHDNRLSAEENVNLQKNVDIISTWVIKILDAKVSEYGRSLAQNSYNAQNDQNDQNDQNQSDTEAVADEQGAEDE